MEPMKWNDNLSVGVTEIDEQHKKEVKLFNQLVENLGDREKTGPLLHEITEHTVMHFKFEEDYFDKFGFEHTAIHKKTHNHFLQQVSHLVDEFDAGKDLDEEHLKFVGKWLVNHILYMDKKYTKCFNDNGVK